MLFLSGESPLWTSENLGWRLQDKEGLLNSGGGLMQFSTPLVPFYLTRHPTDISQSVHNDQQQKYKKYNKLNEI